MRGLLRERQCTEVLVLDASAFFSSVQMLARGCLVTTTYVYDEVRDRESYEKVLLTMELGRVIVLETPDVEVKLSKKVEEKLSNADRSLLKLAYYLRKEGYSVYLVTDDYALQNAAVQLGLEYIPTKTMGVKKLGQLK